MTNKLNRVFLEKLGGSDPTQFIGDEGELFFDPTTGVLRISDGSTPGGIILGALGSTGYCGSFYDTTNQTNPVANTHMSMKLNSSSISDGVQIVDLTKIKMLHTGNFNIQFSAQIKKTDAGTDYAWIWLRKNGTDLVWTNTQVRLTGNDDALAAAWNWLVSAEANDYFEIRWMSDDTNLFLAAHPANTFDSTPGIPSLIVTVTQV